jgi:hypothetical protein
VIALISAGLTGTAIGQPVAQPGTSAADQYTETVPTSGGGAPSEGIGGGSTKKALGAHNAERLEAIGEDGRATAALAASTESASPSTEASPRGGSSGSLAAGNDGGGKQGHEKAATRSDSASALDEVLPAGTSSSGEMGIALPLICLAAAVASIAYLLRRKRQLT